MITDVAELACFLALTAAFAICILYMAVTNLEVWGKADWSPADPVEVQGMGD